MADTFTFTLDDETEKRLFELLTDVDVSKTPSFSIKDKHGNEAEYVKAIRCKDCPNRFRYSQCYLFKDEEYCAWAKDEEKEDIRRCGSCKHFLGGGDFGTCCDQTYSLKYRHTKACEKYSERKEQ